jgi:hypothetical protein
MNHQELELHHTQQATFGDLILPQPCTHDEALELRRQAGVITRKLEPTQCSLCGQRLPGNSSLRARDFPGLIHAVVFFISAWAVYLVNPGGEARQDIALLVAWLLTFVISYALQTPLRSARNAWAILFAISWLLFYAFNWRYVTASYLVSHTIHKWADCFVAITPIMASCGIRAVLERLKRKAQREREEEEQPL